MMIDGDLILLILIRKSACPKSEN